MGKKNSGKWAVVVILGGVLLIALSAWVVQQLIFEDIGKPAPPPPGEQAQ